MTHQELIQILDMAGLPYAYYSYPEDAVPAPPYFVYYFAGTDNFGADNEVYANIYNLTIELYTQNKDLASEAAIEAALQSGKIFWNKTELYIDAENAYEILYEMEVMING